MNSMVADSRLQNIPGRSSERRSRPRVSNIGRKKGRITERLAVAISSIVACCSLILSLVATAPAATGAESDPRYAILLVGVSGDPDLQKIYLEEVRRLHFLLTGQLGYQNDQVIVLFDDPEKDPELIRYKSTRKGLQKATLELSQRVGRSDSIFVFIDGHGSYDGKTYKLNLVGNPDPTAGELAEILYSIPAGRFIVVNATNCSGGALQALSREGNIVITATKSGMEGNQTHMGAYFVEALGNRAADSNKDGRVSVLEAFIYTNRKVEDYYKNEGNLQTEHSVLEDNGDGQGQRDPNPENKEGLLARTTFFDRETPPENLETVTAEQQKLELEARELEKEIEALKYRKAELPQADYEKKLEELLLKLAQINAQIQQ